MENLEEYTVSVYIKNYKIKGIDRLTMTRSSSAKRKLNPEQEKVMGDGAANKTPDQVGFEYRKNWTIELIRQWIIKEFKVISVIGAW